MTHVVLHLETGGLERVVLSLVSEGLRLGQRVSVLCLEKPGELAGEVASLGATVRTLGKPPGLKLGLVGRIATTLRELETSVVHTHQIGALFYAGPAARWAGVTATVHTEHGKHFDGNGRVRWLGRISGLAARRYCCVSSDIAASVVRHRIVPQRKVVVVANGIETARFGDVSPVESVAVRERLGIPTGARVIGTVANLREVKRQDVLIRAFARMAAVTGIAPHLVLVGDGPLRGELSELAAALGVGDRVHFAGAQSRPELFLGLMDVFALTSRSEGMPLSVIEAAAAGLPVVASRVGGLPEVVDDGRTGFLFPPADVGALADLFGRLLSDPAWSRRVGLAAQADARARFDVSAMAGAYARQYDELLGRAAGAAASPPGAVAALTA